MKKRAYTPPAVNRVDLVSHEVALQVCKTATSKTQPNGTNRTCTSGGPAACKTIASSS